jgi:hypothetical protein
MDQANDLIESGIAPTCIHCHCLLIIGSISFIMKVTNPNTVREPDIPRYFLIDTITAMLRAIDTPLAHFSVDIQKAVEPASPLCRGQSFVDHLHISVLSMAK